MVKNSKKFLGFSWVIVVFVFLVIAAGGIVRTTQSGMGCPDWPKCFGMWIPPTNANQLPPNFEKYLRQQDIDHSFNVYHTWVEYINRLLGAVLGVLMLIHLVWSYQKFFKKNKSIFLWSGAMLVLVGFQGWLGKKVVDANLATFKITVHMLTALVLAAIPLYIIQKIVDKKVVVSKRINVLCLAAIVLLLLQIILGTQVREQVDEIAKSLHYKSRNLWIDGLDIYFFIHRSFSLVVGIACVWLWYIGRGIRLITLQLNWMMALVIGIICLGICMAYFNLPAIAQPLHLLCSSVLAMVLFSIKIRLR